MQKSAVNIHHLKLRYFNRSANVRIGIQTNDIYERKVHYAQPSTQILASGHDRDDNTSMYLFAVEENGFLMPWVACVCKPS